MTSTSKNTDWLRYPVCFTLELTVIRTRPLRVRRFTARNGQHATASFPVHVLLRTRVAASHLILDILRKGSTRDKNFFFFDKVSKRIQDHRVGAPKNAYVWGSTPRAWMRRHCPPLSTCARVLSEKATSESLHPG
ncbi:hypothetical protein PAXRUDRAFT_472707 [Paxillus rubicundulus Ve08.2h10]|uniref:Uncharacterized protein n=1 Tax=Paxillus rubicundulus Ve08.2h10 TaxID=930991 RepID=A0A0D0DPU5_9AGAM|nr:hypothetical protein PAXRUDRAFT_472707 [Paxillus rubicundulus Ve08.2h10]